MDFWVDAEIGRVLVRAARNGLREVQIHHPRHLRRGGRYPGGLDGPNHTTGRRRVVCALAQSPAAERRLMVWPPSTKKGQTRRIPCSFEGISMDMLWQTVVENPEKSIVIIDYVGLPR